MPKSRRNPLLGKPPYDGRLRLNPAHPLNQRPVAWWPINEGSGARIRNCVNNACATFDPLASLTWGQDVRGGHLAFSRGAYDPIAIANPPDFPLTVAYWVMETNQSSGNIHFGICTSGSNWICLGSWPGSTVISGTYNIGLESSAALLNVWSRIVMVQTASDLKIYVNGVDKTYVGTGDNWFSRTTSYIGGREPGGYVLYGRIADFQIMNRAWSASDVLADYANPYGTAGNPRFLVEPRRVYFVASGGANITVTPTPADASGTGVDCAIVLGSISITPTAATSKGVIASPSVALGSLQITPAVSDSKASSIAPDIVLGAVNVSPVASVARGSDIAPGIVLGSLVVSPAVASAPASSIDPSVALGSLEISPAAASGAASVVDPTVEAGGNVSISPAAATSAGSSIDPGVVMGSISATPNPATASALVAAPDVALGSLVITPSALSARASGIDPSVILSLIALTPEAVIARALVGGPGIVSGSMVITPAALCARTSVTVTIHVSTGVLAAHITRAPKRNYSSKSQSRSFASKAAKRSYSSDWTRRT
jgi:hypothetical protein